MDLKNAAVLVTGGSCGIGFETARLLVADVSKEDDVQRLIGAVVKEYSDYSVLINNAGFGALPRS